MRYIVMECHPSYAVLLDSDGRFVKACNMNYEIGQSVYEPVLIGDTENFADKIIRAEKRKRVIKYALAAACILAFLCFNVFRFFITPYTEIYISINPEIKIEMNRIGKVISVEGMNADGEAVLTGLVCDTTEPAAVCRAVIEKAYSDGYLSESKKVVLYIDSDDNSFRSIGEELNNELSYLSADEYGLTVEILDISQYVFGEKNSSADAFVSDSESDSSAEPSETASDTDNTEGHHGNSNEHGHNTGGEENEGHNYEPDDDYDDDDDDDDDDGDDDDGDDEKYKDKDRYSE